MHSSRSSNSLRPGRSHARRHPYRRRRGRGPAGNGRCCTTPDAGRPPAPARRPPEGGRHGDQIRDGLHVQLSVSPSTAAPFSAGTARCPAPPTGTEVAAGSSLRNIRRRGRNGRNGLRRRNRPLLRSRLDLPPAPESRSPYLRKATGRRGAWRVSHPRDRVRKGSAARQRRREPPPRRAPPPEFVASDGSDTVATASRRNLADRIDRRLHDGSADSTFDRLRGNLSTFFHRRLRRPPAKGFRQEPLSRQASPPELRPAFRPALPPGGGERRLGRAGDSRLPQRAARSSVLPAAQRPDPLRNGSLIAVSGITASRSISTGGRSTGDNSSSTDGCTAESGRNARHRKGSRNFPSARSRSISLFRAKHPILRPMPRAFAVPHEAFSNPSVSSYFNFSKV